MMLVFTLFLSIQFADLLKSTRAKSYSQIDLEPKRVSWTTLSYRAKKLTADVNTQVSLESLPKAEVEATLIKSAEGVPIKISRPKAYKLTVNRVVDSLFSSPVTSTSKVWFNPRDATALGRERLRVGKKDFKKTYRFTDQGVFRHRREPKGRQEALKQPENWTDVRDTFYRHDLGQMGCANVTERLILIYIVSAADLSENMQPLSFCVFGRRKLFHVQLIPDGMHSLKVDFIEKSHQGEIYRQDEVDALKIDFQIQPLASELDEDEEFSFLGFEKDIAIFIDPATRIPLQLSGKIPNVGNETVKLHEVWLR
jgi:hypothetical protein